MGTRKRCLNAQAAVIACSLSSPSAMDVDVMRESARSVAFAGEPAASAAITSVRLPGGRPRAAGLLRPSTTWVAKSSQTLDSPPPLVCATDEGPRSHSVVLTRDSPSSNRGATAYHISCGLPSVGALRVSSATLGRSSSSIARRSPLAFGFVYRSGSPVSASVREGAMSANSEYASRLTGSSRAWYRPTCARSRT